VLVAGALAASAAGAQVRLPLQRPGDERPPLPPYEGDARDPALALPPPPPARPGRAGGGTVRVDRIRVEGATALEASEIEALLAPYVGRDLRAEELVALRDALTRAYVERGHLNSGAVIAPQDLADGELEVVVVEGRLEEVTVEGLSWLREGYVRGRVELGAGVPLDVHSLEERLRLLRDDPRIGTLHAELQPGAAPGLARLHVRAEEARPWHAAFDAGTVQSPSVGGWRVGPAIWHDNVTGFGDTLRASYGWTEGLNDVQGGWTFPLCARGTALEAYGRYGDAAVVEEPFDALEVESLSWTVGVGVLQPVWLRPGRQLTLSLRGELRESRTFLLDEPFSFVAGLPDERARVAVLRFGQDFLWRDATQVLAARSLLSFGLDVLGATRDPELVPFQVPDGDFFAWLAQVQYARRLPFQGIEILARVDAQLADDPLLPLEQFSVGGLGSVRGYRVNQIVRDNAVVGSLELRISMLRRVDGSPLLQLVPFTDQSYAWNTSLPTPAPRWLGSVGVGFRWFVFRRVVAEAYWGARLADVPALPDPDLQDRGFSVRVSALLF